jgi:hypothetical protein
MQITYLDLYDRREEGGALKKKLSRLAGAVPLLAPTRGDAPVEPFNYPIVLGPFDCLVRPSTRGGLEVVQPPVRASVSLPALGGAPVPALPLEVPGTALGPGDEVEPLLYREVVERVLAKKGRLAPRQAEPPPEMRERMMRMKGLR